MFQMKEKEKNFDKTDVMKQAKTLMKQKNK